MGSEAVARAALALASPPPPDLRLAGMMLAKLNALDPLIKQF